jgi:hypothetical protein
VLCGEWEFELAFGEDACECEEEEGCEEEEDACIGVIPNAIRTLCARCCGCGVPPPALSTPFAPGPSGESTRGGGLGARDCNVKVRKGPRKGDVLGVGCHAPLPLALELLLLLLLPHRIVNISESLVPSPLDVGGLALARLSSPNGSGCEEVGDTMCEAERECVDGGGRGRTAGSREAGVICHAGPLSRRWFLLDFSRSRACERR